VGTTQLRADNGAAFLSSIAELMLSSANEVRPRDDAELHRGNQGAEDAELLAAVRSLGVFDSAM
jgi:hypothetical protein